MELLLLCVSGSDTPQRTMRIKGLLDGTVDWERFLQLSLKHGLMPLVHLRLKDSFALFVPAVQLERLRRSYLQNSARNLLLTHELCAILNLFRAHDIQALPYKGPALAAQVYGDTSLRMFVDLDVLVRWQDVARAQEVMIEHGYSPILRMDATQYAAFFRSECDQVFMGRDGAVGVELHWAITPPYFSFPLSTEDLLENVERVEILGTDTPIPSAEDILLLLCVNGAKDMWDRLETICTFAELVRARQQLDWARLWRQAARAHGERMLLLGLLLARDLAGLELPAEALNKIDSDRRVKTLAAGVKRRLLAGALEMPGVVEKARFRLATRERMADRARYCLLRALTPTYKDWSLVPLPRTVYFLYYLLRPFRLFKEWASTSFRGA
jgi:hypothetical protein